MLKGRGLTLDDIIGDLEAYLKLERELGTRTLDFDPALLAPLAPPVAPAASAAAPSAKNSRPPASESAARDDSSRPAGRPRLAVIASTPADFEGAPGELFDKMLGAINLARADATLVVAGPDAAAQAAAAAPALVLLLGREAARAFAPRRRIARAEWQRVGGVLVSAMPSPAFMLRFYADDPVELTKLKRECWAVLKRVPELLDANINPER